MAVTDSLINWTITQIFNEIGYIGIGTGVEPTQSSVTLQNEGSRKAVDKFIDLNTAIIEGFWDETEANGVTWTNAAVFGNGDTAIIGSGNVFAGGAINIPKTNTQSMTVSVEITVEAVN
ncbi:hypothetical protein [Paenibacillus naphthalenovorans]|uniref:hypothetical protein n=1 Tax=Paenibacillus naphthalenovorans TaxID=162209 RepID=UPI003D2D1409